MMPVGQAGTPWVGTPSPTLRACRGVQLYTKRRRTHTKADVRRWSRGSLPGSRFHQGLFPVSFGGVSRGLFGASRLHRIRFSGCPNVSAGSANFFQSSSNAEADPGGVVTAGYDGGSEASFRHIWADTEPLMRCQDSTTTSSRSLGTTVVPPAQGVPSSLSTPASPSGYEHCATMATSSTRALRWICWGTQVPEYSVKNSVEFKAARRPVVL